MNSIQLYIYFQLFTIITTLLYPCQYIDSNERLLKCDICKCLSLTSIYLTSNLCSLTASYICMNNPNEELLRLKLDEISSISSQTENQIEFHNFNHDITNYEQLCQVKNFTQITFFNLIFNFSSNQIPKCLSQISSLRFINSLIENRNYLSEKLTFYNTTFDINNFNLISTKILILNSVQFLIKPFDINSIISLTHLTITQTKDYNLIGLFPHLSYLNLASTKLNDKQLNKIFSQITVPDLSTMILSDNQLTTISNRFPSTIRYLDLSKNHIKSLDYYSFKSLYSLNILNLSYNSPLEIQQDTFTRIPYLEILDLSYSLPTLSFDDLFVPLQKLRQLNISGNHLDAFPNLPTPYDAHSIESLDHHLPVLYVDLSKNNFEKMDFENFLSPSAQDKYILTINMNHNRLKTLYFPSILLNDTKRRGPFIEFDVNNNPLECDCNLYETILNLFKNSPSYKKQTISNLYPSFQQKLPTTSYSSGSNRYARYRRQYNLVQQTFSTNTFARQSHIRFLDLSNLTCIDTIDPSTHRSLFNLNSSNSFCSYRKYCPSTCSCCSSPSISKINCDCYMHCPIECSCQHSYDLTNNYVNCSHRQLNQIPLRIPYSTTHLFLNNNQIKAIENNLTYLINLKYLSLANNYLAYLSNYDFSTMIKMEHLDLSSNRIENIQSKTFSDMINLKKLYLHNNLWIPKFYKDNVEFQSNIRLNFLTYANSLSCTRPTTSSLFPIEGPLTAIDCCKYSTSESCQIATSNIIINNDNHVQKISSTKSNYFLTKRIHEKYIILTAILILFVLTCIITVCIYRKKRMLLLKQKYLSNSDIQKEVKRSRKKGLNSNPTYNHQENDNSLSYTDEDDYASIPLTISQTDSSSDNRFPSVVPPLPPPRSFTLNRPISHSSTTSTSITIRSSKNPYTSSLKTTHSCLQIKLDVLVLYSINDSEYINDTIGRQLENMYGRRFSFYFIHRDRMLGELDWLMANSCVTLLILRKPYNLIHDYMKILSTCLTLKCFIILINNDLNHQITSIKVREKIARLYQTSDIYEWNSKPASLIHEQLELFLEQHCGSATYVTE
ncbi:unnamed protein product [Rotaria magnacalcarata]|uniref:LRRNT domain-containing protein n=1 Tax=Rotaria magnacalcarata TaxID=392030 RepID=A0A815YCK2_9BILA|nr:unnamed protein product [Rotaria magnacalcarata]CAF1568077.1 unnamed protein product [Rotaria magnacalcarata]CAF1922877.1 unnamed protein product [Rotaria magnacalcarata]CAF3823677.1 unnamed protein product [Rotaria magnacalcarata]CAF3960074.1 unnamed protein product [Rotaria magnacalcarata]